MSWKASGLALPLDGPLLCPPTSHLQTSKSPTPLGAAKNAPLPNHPPSPPPLPSSPPALQGAAKKKAQGELARGQKTPGQGSKSDIYKIVRMIMDRNYDPVRQRRPSSSSSSSYHLIYHLIIFILQMIIEHRRSQRKVTGRAMIMDRDYDPVRH